MSENSFQTGFLSWKPKRETLNRPLYLSLANALEADILNGTLAAGTRLPPQRDLADYLEINFTTVTRAYDLCREKGLIYGVVGRGSYVAMQRSERSAGRAVRFDFGDVNGFDTLTSPLIEATRAVLSKGYLERLYNYAEPAGHPHQRAAGQLWLSQMGVKSDVEHTVIFSGAQNIISTALATLFKLGDCVAVDEFTYPNLIGAARLFHIQLIPIPGDSGGMIPEELENICGKRRISGLFLMPNCSNPTTVTLSNARRTALAEIAERHNLTVLEDDTMGGMRSYADLIPFHTLLPEQTVFIAGSTKCLGSGLRVAFAAIPDAYLQPMRYGLQHLNIKTSSLDAEIITELILSGKASEIMAQKESLAQQANRICNAVLQQPGDPMVRPAFFCWHRLPDGRYSGQDLEEKLESAGFRVYHANRFQCKRETAGNYLRLSLSSAADLSSLGNGLKSLQKKLQEFFAPE
ncbi:MAG: PLP-dependent aminotransferase family protein [Lentisphaeria bacterium]|nr:PLP-dependent aminotransferase family protein [Lentisphaeria bacterium]